MRYIRRTRQHEGNVAVMPPDVAVTADTDFEDPDRKITENAFYSAPSETELLTITSASDVSLPDFELMQAVFDANFKCGNPRQFYKITDIAKGGAGGGQKLFLDSTMLYMVC